MWARTRAGDSQLLAGLDPGNGARSDGVDPGQGEQGKERLVRRALAVLLMLTQVHQTLNDDGLSNADVRVAAPRMPITHPS
jgi:hypothetical protein